MTCRGARATTAATPSSTTLLDLVARRPARRRRRQRLASARPRSPRSRKEFPDRVVNVGIAEQDLVGVGAGLANGGKIPFVCAASPFLTGRALEQIKVDVAYSAANVKLVGVSSGVAYGELGPTHHSIEDVAWTRAIDGLTVIVPADPHRDGRRIRAAYGHAGPDLHAHQPHAGAGRSTGPDYRASASAGRPLLREGDDVTLIANGVMVHRALEAAELLAAEGIAARVLNMATVSPIDREAIVAAARETARHRHRRGAHRRAAASAAPSPRSSSREHPVPMRILGFPGFAPTGSTDFLLEWAGLTAEGIAAPRGRLVSA